MTVAEAVDGLPRRVASWAASRPLAVNSMTGISLALGMCAAVWFTAGTRSGNVTAALALCGGYLVSRSARGLETAAGAKSVSDGRLARGCATLAEYGIYAGLAAGGNAAAGAAAGRPVSGGLAADHIGMWQLATTVVIVLAVGRLASACGRRPAPRGQRPWSPASLTRQFAAFPDGGRVLVIAVAAPALGARAALIGLLGWSVIAAGYAVVSGRPQQTGNAGVRPGSAGVRPGSAGVRPGSAGVRPGSAASVAVVACRDDGPIADQVGLLTRGQLIPLPPALTGLAAASVLAMLGMRNLPGFLLLAPVVAMLLAAVGASHPHDGPVDWIVPAILQAGQFIYVAAIGFASGVPAPVIFALCALIALHYADLAGHAQQRAALGWDGRMIAVGVAAALGVPTFGDLLLAAYLIVLICREIMTSWPAAMAETAGDRHGARPDRPGGQRRR